MRERPRDGQLIFVEDVPFANPINFSCAVALLVIDRNLRGDKLAFKPLGWPTYVLGRLRGHVNTQLQAVRHACKPNYLLCRHELGRVASAVVVRRHDLAVHFEVAVV